MSAALRACWRRLVRRLSIGRDLERSLEENEKAVDRLDRAVREILKK